MLPCLGIGLLNNRFFLCNAFLNVIESFNQSSAFIKARFGQHGIYRECAVNDDAVGGCFGDNPKKHDLLLEIA